MDITPLVRSGQQIIQGYKNGRFKVNGQSYDGPVYVTPDKTISWEIDGAHDVSGWNATHFDIVMLEAKAIDVLLLGTGQNLVFLPRALKDALKQSGLCPEVMDTGAACRTYNVLMAEGRRVGALLMPFA